LSHGSHGGGYHGRTATGSIDLGHEPPLSVNGQDATFIDRRRVSVQWFSGTILTGLCGAALIGGAVFTALDGETTFASVPERIEGALRGAFGANEKATTRKTDRLPPPSEATAARTVIRVSQVERAGHRDIVRVRPYTRISGNLSLTTSELSAKIPPFNAQRLLTDVGSPLPAPGEESQAADDAAPDAEVSFVTRDLAAILPRARIATAIPIDDVIIRVRDASNWRGNGNATGGVRYASASTPSDMRLAYAAEGQADPYAGFEARVVPENVTQLGKTKEQATGGHAANERVHIVKKGESVATILRDAGASPDEIKAIAAQLGARGRDGGLKEGQKLRVLMMPQAPGRKPQAVRVITSANTSTSTLRA
jgi:hypothetical protein